MPAQPGPSSPSARAVLPPSFARTELAVLMDTSHVNLLGNVHGGVIMRQADSTAGAVAQRHSGGPAVTAAMDELSFLQPVHVGDILRTMAQVNWAGSSSMEIGVRVETQRWNETGEPLHVASAYLVFVAIDDEARPRAIPGLEPQDDQERRRMREAGIRRAHRLARRREIEEGRTGAP